MSQIRYNLFLNRGGKMKKKNILNLIKYHTERNETAFRNEAYEIAKYFDKSNDVTTHPIT